MSKRRRGCVVVALGAAAVVCAGGLGTLWLGGSAGNAFLRAQIESQISAQIPGSVQIDELHTDLWGGADLRGVRLLDPAGSEVLSAQQIDVALGTAGSVDLDISGLDGLLTLDRAGQLNLITSIGELPELPAVAVGALQISGRLDLDIGGFELAIEQLNLRGSGASQPLSADLALITARVDSELGSAPVDGSASLGWDGSVLSIESDLDLADRQLVTTGSLETRWPGGVVDLQVQLSGELPEPFAGSIDARAQLMGPYRDLRVTGASTGDLESDFSGAAELDDPDWPASATGSVVFGDIWDALPAGTLAQGRFTAGVDLRPESAAQVQYDGTLELAGLGFPQSRVELEISEQGVGFTKLDLDGPHQASGSWRIDWEGDAGGEVATSLALDQLGTIGVPQGVDGRLGIRVEVSNGALSGAVQVRELRFQGLSIPSATGPVRGVLDPDYQVEALAELSIPRVHGRGVEVHQASIPLAISWAPGSPLLARGTGTAEGAAVLGIVDLVEPRATVLLRGVPGSPLFAEAELAVARPSSTGLPIDSLTATGTLRGDALAGSIHALTPWGAISTRARSDLHTGHSTLVGTRVEPLHGAPWSQRGQASAQIADSGITDLTVTLESDRGEVMVEGDLGEQDSSLAILGSLDLSVLEPWAPNIPPVGGSARFEGTLALDEGEPHAALSVLADSLTLGEFPIGSFSGTVTTLGESATAEGSASIRGQTVALDMEAVLDPRSGLALDSPWSATVSSSDLIAGRMVLSGTPRQPRVEGQALLRWKDEVVGQLAARGDGDEIELTGRLWDGLGTLDGTLQPDWAELIAGHPVHPTGESRLRVEVPWDVVLRPLQLSMPVSGSFKATGEAWLDGWSVITRGSWSTEGSVGEIAVIGEGILQPGQLDGQVSIGDGEIVVHATHAPIDLREPPDGRAAITAHGVPLAVIEALSPDLVDVRGGFDAEIAITPDGALGSVSLQDGSVRHRFLGIVLEDLEIIGGIERSNMTFELAATTHHARAGRDRPGRVELSTKARLGFFNLTDIDGNATLDEALVLSRPGQRARLSTPRPLVLSGSLWNPSVRGLIQVDEADVDLDRRLLAEADLWPMSPTEIDDRIRVLRDGMEVPRPPGTSEPFWSSIDALIAIDLGSQTEGAMALPYVDQLGGLIAEASRVRMDGRVTGDVQLRVTDGEAYADGTIDVVRAEARVANSTFGIDRAQVRFVDGDPLQPFLRAQGALVLDDGATINLFLRGTPDDASMTLTSVQLARTDEVWAAVVSGRNPNAIRSSVGMATSLATGVLFRTMFDRMSLGRWQWVSGGLQARYRVARNWTLIPRYAPLSYREDDFLLTTVYTPRPRLRLSLGVGLVDRWLGAEWQRRY